MKSKITRESILARRTKIKKVSIPEYGEYFMRVLTRSEFDTVKTKSEQLKPNDPTALTKGLIAAALTDEDGKVVFDFTKQEDLDAIGDLEYPVVNALDAHLAKSHFPAKDKSELAVDAKN